MRFYAVWLSMCLLASGGTMVGLPSRAALAAEPHLPAVSAPVLLELFTSEGCSSCPAAESLLARWVKQGRIGNVPIVALEWHVDYWNDIGWKDPFSSAKYTERQQQYAQIISGGRVYTPQLVIDGHLEAVGSDEARSQALIAQASRLGKARIELRHQGGELRFTVQNLSDSAVGNSDLWLALCESQLVSIVKSGENAGQTLAHGPVVRELRRLQPIGSMPLQGSTTPKLAPGSQPEHMHAVVFAQHRKFGTILGAAQVSLAAK